MKCTCTYATSYTHTLTEQLLNTNLFLCCVNLFYAVLSLQSLVFDLSILGQNKQYVHRQTPSMF